jgi:hypothetical protein
MLAQLVCQSERPRKIAGRYCKLDLARDLLAALFKRCVWFEPDGRFPDCGLVYIVRCKDALHISPERLQDISVSDPRGVGDLDAVMHAGDMKT